MSDWKICKTYCYKCRSWKTDIKHKDCPKSGGFIFLEGLVWIDLETMQMGCNKCNQLWPVETSIFHCSCGHVQKTYYTDSVIELEVTDEVIWTEGNMMYVQKASGEVVVGYRDFHNVGY